MWESLKKNLDLIAAYRKFGLKKTIYLFFSNLAVLIESGISLPDAIQGIRQEESSKRMKVILDEVQTKVARGVPFSEALASSGIVSNRIKTLIRVGEESGQLVNNLNLVNEQNDKEMVFRSKIRSSLLYALVVLTIAAIVMFSTTLFILPKLAEFYDQLDADLPLLTRVLIDTGNFLASYGYVLIPLVVIAIFVCIYFLFSFPKTRFIGHSILFHIPMIKKLLRYSEVSNFGFILGSELKAGIPMMHALADLPTTTTFKNYQLLYLHLQTSVTEGNSLHNSILSYPKIDNLIPSQARMIISAGEKSGQLSLSLLKVAKIYERKVDNVAKNLPTILEPLIILIIGVFISVIALATILPIYSLSSAF